MRILKTSKVNKFLFGIMMMAILLCCSSQVQAAQDGDYTYTVIDSKAEITKYTGAGGVVTIPSILAGFPVTSIGCAFFESTGLTTIRFNSATTTVYDDEFTIPTSTKIIGFATSTAKDYATKYDRVFEVIRSITVKGVSLNKKITTINVGANETLTATIAPTSATNQNVTWKSSKPSVATVDSNGKIVGVKAGKAAITVTTVEGSKTATCTVTVRSTPMIPTGLSATALGSSQIKLSWNAVTGATSYKIYSSASATGTFKVVGTSTTTGYSDKNLTAITTYYYKVSAVNANGEGTKSSAVPGTTTVNAGWVPVGSPGFSNGQALNSSLSISNGTPYVAYRDSSHEDKATVMKYDGSNWVPMGNEGFSSGRVDSTSLFVYNDTPYVAYKDGANGSKATVMKYDGRNWVTVGNAGFSGGEANNTLLYISNGTPYVAYGDVAGATVMKYDGSNWVLVGNAGFSSGESYPASLYVYNGTPYVEYPDAANDYKTTVMKFGIN